MKIATNPSATAISNALSRNQRDMAVTMERLSTGLRINSAADDAAGLSIASKMTAQINSLDQAGRNINDAIGLLQTADAGLENIELTLQRILELSVQSASGAVSDDQRVMIGEEVAQLIASIDSTVESTSWNSLDLLNGNFKNKEFQIGVTNQDRKNFSLADVSAKALFDYTIPEISFANGDFSSLDGWDIYLEQIILGRDGSSGLTQVAGFPSPEDPTPYPANASGKTSRGDNYSPVNPSYSYSLSSSLRLESSMTTSSGGDVVHGPYVVSKDSVFISAGSTVSFDWRAQGGSDAYDVFAYILDVNSGRTVELLNLTGSGTQDSGWSTVTHTLANEGNYKFVFASGTFDESFGKAAGASLFIDNIEVSGNVAPIDYSQLLPHASQSDAALALSKIDTAIKTISTSRAYVGAEINTLGSTASSIHNVSQHLASSRSKIEDTDYASETTQLARTKIIEDAATAMLAQANQRTKRILDLFE